MKQKNIWICSECGQKEPKWSGICPVCGKWNTLIQEVEIIEKNQRYSTTGSKNKRALKLSEISIEKTPRITTGVNEFDRLMGGGVVPGSLILVGGDPGIGKSTLMLQLSKTFADQGLIVLYISGEESVEQTSLRAKRLNVNCDNLFIFAETNFNHIKKEIDKIKPNVLIVDSIQIVYKSEIPSAPGSVSQVRENASEFMHIAKNLNIVTFLIGHVTKSGEIAGPRMLEHLVDTVLYFEGDKQNDFRMIRGIKNRFGPTDEIAVFQMQNIGLVEVPNPSKFFLEERSKEKIGSVIVPTIEGTRPILIETQALVTDTSFSTPSRRSTGIDQNRLALLLAVLEKRMGFQLYRSDVFVSIAGGINVKEPGVDLGVLLAVASSLLSKKVDFNTAIVGEVGLGGEIRACSRIDSRIKEAINMGFKRIIIPKRNIRGLPKEIQDKIQLIGVSLVEEAVKNALN